MERRGSKSPREAEFEHHFEAFRLELRALRKNKRLSLRAVGDRTSPFLGASALSRIERGQRHPRLATLWALARELDLRITIDAAGMRIERARKRAHD